MLTYSNRPPGERQGTAGGEARGTGSGGAPAYSADIGVTVGEYNFHRTVIGNTYCTWLVSLSPLRVVTTSSYQPLAV